MAYAKEHLKHDAYNALNGWFPTDKVIFYYKGCGCTKADFKRIDEERLNNVAS